MKLKMIFFLILIVIIIVPAVAIERSAGISDREIIEALAGIKGDIKKLETEIKGDIKRLEEGQRNLLREMDKRFEAVDKRFEAVDKRFEAVDKRFGAVDKRFEEINERFGQLVNIFIGIVAAFAGIVTVTISLAIWDRRTAIAPVAAENREIKEREETIERALKEYAKSEPKLAEALRIVGLL